MTVTDSEPTLKDGRVVAIAGPVIDVEFPPDAVPGINMAISFDITIDGNKQEVRAEVAQQIGDSRVRAICLRPTDGLVRGMSVENTGANIMMPVGREILGRILNVVGEPVDERGPVTTKKKMPIHRPAPKFVEQSVKVEMFETGIKVIDLLAPYRRGGKIGLFGGAGVGKTVTML